MTDVASNIMKKQDSDRLWLQPRDEINDYLTEVVAHACRPMDTFPPYKKQTRTEEVIEIDRKITELQLRRREIVNDTPGEVVIRGIRSRRREDGSMPFSILLPGIVGPVHDINNIPVLLQNIWIESPLGEDSHQVKLNMRFSSGQLGEQRLRMYLDFVQRRDADEEDFESDREIYPEDVDGR